MHLNTNQLKNLCTVAIVAAQEAGKLIAAYHDIKIDVKLKKMDLGDAITDSSNHNLAAQVLTEVDIKSQEIILKHLSPSLKHNNIGVLSEESADNFSRFDKDYFWCIDPLDGTLSFIEGKPGYAVSIALVSKIGNPIIGVVYDPVRKNLYHAIENEGAFKNHNQITLRNNTNTFSFITDSGFAKHADFDTIRKTLLHYSASIGYGKFEQIDYGGAVMNAIWVIENSPACYFKLPKPTNGGGSLWDFAATACICTQLGMPVTDFKNNLLNLNRKESTFMNQDGVIYASNTPISQFIQELNL